MPRLAPVPFKLQMTDAGSCCSNEKVSVVGNSSSDELPARLQHCQK